MLYIWTIEKIIESELKELKIYIDYEFDNQLPAPMSYNISTRTLKFNYLQINGYRGKIRVRETDEDFVRLILYHTVGYYLDYQKNKHDIRTLVYGGDEEKQELLSQIEKNAWEYGRSLVPERLIESYDKMRELDSLLVK